MGKSNSWEYCHTEKGRRTYVDSMMRPPYLHVYGLKRCARCYCDRRHMYTFWKYQVGPKTSCSYVGKSRDGKDVT